MLKKILSLLLVFALILQVFVPVASAAYTEGAVEQLVTEDTDFNVEADEQDRQLYTVTGQGIIVCPVVVEGRFMDQAAAQGGLAGAEWRLCEDGTLEIDAGFIISGAYWDEIGVGLVYGGTATPWSATPYVDQITRIVFTGSVTAGSNLNAFFANLENLVTIEGLENLDTSNVRAMALLFANASSLVNLDLSSFDTSNVINMSRMFQHASSLTNLDLSSFDTGRIWPAHMRFMFYDTTSLRVLTLGQNFRTYSGSSSFPEALSLSPVPSNARFTGYWQNVGFGTVDNPTGEFVFTSAELAEQFDRATMADTFVWQPVRDDLCPVIVEGRFANQAVAQGGLTGAPWRLCDDGILMVDEGFIQWDMWHQPNPLSPWFAYNDSIDRIIFTGPITTGTHLVGLFAGLSNVTTIDGLTYFDTSSAVHMSFMFNATPNLTSLDLSSFDTRNAMNMIIMFNETSLSQLTLGEKFQFIVTNPENPPLRAIAPTSEFTGYWQSVGSGTADNPTGEFVFTSAELLAQFDGATMADTFVWQPVRDDLCPVIVEGRFANQAAAQGGVAGSVWRICEDGTLEIESGFINWTLYSGPWHAYRNNITAIVIGGPVTAGTSLRSLFRDLPYVTEIEGLTHLDTSRTTNMENMFRASSSLVRLDLSSFDTSRVTNMTRMFTNTNALKELTLGSQFSFAGAASLPVIRMTDEYTGMWQNVGEGTVADPRGEFVFTSAQLMSQFDGSMTDTFVWQPVRDDLCPVIVEGRFANQATAQGGLAGSVWRLCEDGTLEIDSGFINWTLYNGPWHAHRNDVTAIVIGGPVTAGSSLRSLFRDLPYVIEIEGLTHLDTSRTTNMENMFRASSSLVRLDLSSFDTSRVTNMTRMFTNTNALRELTLGSQFSFAGAASLPVIRMTDEYTGMWQNVGEGTVADPRGEFVFTSAQLMSQFDGSMTDTFVWQPVRDDLCPVIVEGRFANQATAQGGLAGAVWRICEDGTLEIDSGFINWTLYNGPWHAHRNDITTVIITGPIIAGTSLRSLFRDLSYVTEIEGLTHLDTSRTTNMENMFRSSNSIVALDLSSFDTSRVTNMTRMFTNTNALRELTLGSQFSFAGAAGLPTVRATDAYTGMWENGEFVFTSAQLMSQFNGTTMSGTFVWQPVRAVITTPTVTVVNGTGSGNFEPGTGVLVWANEAPVGYEFARWESTPTVNFIGSNSQFALFMMPPHDVTITAVFEPEYIIATGTVGIAGAPWRLYNDGRLFVEEGINRLTPGSTTPWLAYRNQVNEMIFTGPFDAGETLAAFFFGMSELTRIEGLENFDTSNVVSMSQMFSYSPRLRELDLSNFNTSNVTSMHGMFRGASGLVELDLSNFDTSNVQSMMQMFADTTSLVRLDISNFNMRIVSDVRGMFYRTISLRELELGSNFRFVNGSSVLNGSNLPWILRNNDFTGYWQNVGDGTVANPQGSHVLTSDQLMNTFNGATMADTFVWQPTSVRPEPTFTVSITGGQIQTWVPEY